jgi:hypothetical protein
MNDYKIYWCIAGIVFLESIALLKGIDGWLLGTAVASLAGIAGFKINDLIRTYGNQKEK